MADDEAPKFAEFPKWVEHPSKLDSRGYPLRVLVKDKKGEDAVLGEDEETPKAKAPKGGWPAK